MPIQFFVKIYQHSFFQKEVKLRKCLGRTEQFFSVDSNPDSDPDVVKFLLSGSGQKKGQIRSIAKCYMNVRFILYCLYCTYSSGWSVSSRNFFLGKLS